MFAKMIDCIKALGGEAIEGLESLFALEGREESNELL